MRDAPAVVLPGVGAFAAGMDALEAAGLVDVLRERIEEGRPTLAVCLGMQLLAESSAEAPGRQGLGVFARSVQGLPADERLPRIGWNAVSVEAGEGAFHSGVAYFAHSYALDSVPSGWRPLRARWGDTPFVAGLERGRVMACQFHPELSGAWGRGLLAAWLLGEHSLKPGETDEAINNSGWRRIIPCLDVRGGRVVKGIRFQGLRDAGDPSSLAAAYESQGADELVVLDVSATPEQRGTAVETVRKVRAELSIPLTVGGGVRTVAHAEALLAAGADKVAVNTAAWESPELLSALSLRFGRQCVVLALDARRDGAGWEVVVRSGTQGTGRDAVAWAREAVERGAGEILLTSWDRDGTMDGYDTDLLAAITQATRVPVIASGGASGAGHMAAAVEAGADAVLAASIFHDAHMTVGDVKQELKALGVEVRQ